jgi:hypothetical protein
MKELGVSQTSVAAALRQLRAEGIVESRPGSGVYVTQQGPVKPLLLLCESASFVQPSPFWEILLEGLAVHWEGSEEGLAAEFTLPIFGDRRHVSLSKTVSSSLWTRIQACRFSAAMAICVGPSATWELEELGIPVVAFGCPSHNMIKLALKEASHLGVTELVQLGCQKIGLYNAPHAPAKVVFKGALSSYGASERILNTTKAFRINAPRFGHGLHLVEYGIEEARRLFGPESNLAERPDGVLSVDELFTQGFIIGLSQYGIQPGRDIEIASTRNKGSAVLLPWRGSITALEFDVQKIAAGLISGAQMLAAGQIPNRDGWENSVLESAKEGPLRTLTISPTLIKKEMRSDTD